MKSIYKTAAVVGLASAMMTACYDDKGNYDYVDLPELTISTEGTGILDYYTIDRGDVLNIAPDVYYEGKKIVNDDDAPLDYIWTLYTMASGLGVSYDVDTLAYTRVLNVPITRAGGSDTFYVQLTVRNRNNNIESYFRTSVKIEETISAGWMVLYEKADKPGYTDVGLIVNPLVKKGVIKNKEFWDLYASSNGAPLEGKPIRVLHETMPMATGGVPRIATSKTLVSVSNTDFTKIQEWNDFFYTPQEKEEITYFGFNSRSAMKESLIVDNKSFLMVGDFSGVGYFGMPKDDEGVGELAPWSSIAPMAFDMVVYDQDNGAFYYSPTNSEWFYTFGAQNPASGFDINNTEGARLLFGDWRFTAPQNYFDVMLFARGDNRYIGEANFGVAPTLPIIGQSFTDVSDSPEIKNATAFATNGSGQYALYGAGNKMYNLAYLSGQPSKVVWEAPSADEVVTCISTMKYHYMLLFLQNMVPNANEVVHIATWNEKTQEGKVYQYKINPAAGTILTQEEHYEYTVPGKVKDMSWKYELAR